MDISRFKMSEMVSHPSLSIVVGKRNSGKSVLVKDILYNMSEFGISRACVFSPTEPSTGFYGKFIPSLFIHHTLTEEALERIYSAQKELVLRKKANISDPGDTKMVIVLDDAAYESKVLASKTLREIFFNSRHYNLYILITLQYLIALPAALRCQVDYAFFMHENVISNRERIHSTFLGSLRPKQFSILFDAITRGYSACCINNRSNGRGKLEESTFHYISNPDLDFKFGGVEGWKYHKKYYESYEERMVRRIKEEDRQRKEEQNKKKNRDEDGYEEDEGEEGYEEEEENETPKKCNKRRGDSGMEGEKREKETMEFEIRIV
jgi:hypothetical protein